MNRIVKFVTVVRRNWKKSAFACALVGYGVKYGNDQFEIQNMMRQYCEEAALLGDAPMSASQSNQIAVILNPAANRRNAKKNFEKYCAPLLHLSGAFVTVIETTHEGHARKIPDELDPKTTAILIAGGDGTLSEAITGLMRSRSETLLVPIGVLPLGRYNTLASHLFGSSPSEVENMAGATMAILRGRKRMINSYRVETLDGDNEKAIYGVGWIEWGTWPWLKKRVKELWYCGPLKDYIALLWPVESALKPFVKASLAYTAPCSGCSKCYSQRPDLLAADAKMSQGANRWWSAFVKKPQASTPSINYKNVENDRCDLIERKVVRTTDLRLTTDGIQMDNFTRSNTESIPPSLFVNIGEKKRYQGEFFKEGLKFLRNEKTHCTDLIAAKQIEIRPNKSLSHQDDKAKEESNSDEEVLLIDNEEFELRPIRVTILPNSLTVFCK